MARSRRKGRRSRRQRRGRARPWAYLIGSTAAVAVVAALILVAVLTQGGGGEVEGGPVVLPSPRATEIPRQGLVLGSVDAPVTVVEYADFQ